MNLFDAETRTLYEREIDAGRRGSLSILVDLVPAGIDVLDVGIGGGALGQCLAVERGCRVDGSTLRAEEAAHAAAYYRRIEVADLNAVGLDTIFAGQRYAAIICADVLEHLSRPTAVLDACRNLLADDGRLLLSIPNVGYSGLIAELLAGEFRYRTEGLLDRSHVRFFTRRSLLRLLREQGWRVDSVTPVFLDLPDSEFRASLDLLPPAVRRYLLALPDGLAYQFIVQARPAAADESISDVATCEPPLHRDATYSMQLYLKRASGYAEDRKLIAAARIGETRQTVRFALPDDCRGLTGLRFDPADRPGFLHLMGMRLLDAQAVSRWSWDGAAGPLESGDTHEVVFRTPWTAEHGVIALLTGDDPYFELPVSAGQLAACGGGGLEVELAWPMSADYLPFVDELRRRSAREEALSRELTQQRAALQEMSERLSHELAQARADRPGAGEQLARRTDELAAAQARIAQLSAELTETARRCAVREEVASALERERRELLAEVRTREAELRGAAQEIASLTHALVHSHNESASATGQRDLLREHVGRLEASRWSRLGTWIAARLGRSGSPLLLRSSSLLPEEPSRELRQPRTGISIVVPVFKGLAETQTCLETVLRSRSAASLHVVVINDASPEAEIGDYLRQLAGRDARVELIENSVNLGFVASVNRGMQQHADDDVILLNSDTEVADDWIDRLRNAAYRERGIATVTPFSNAATICSYPKFCVDSPMPADMSTAALDRYFAAENAGHLIDIPTAVGFCMFIRRDCLDEIGAFDADRFGRGYGEENDFCMRARGAGWRHVLAPDTFVRHAGSVSFGAEKAVRVQEALALLARLHPDYQPSIDRHLLADPARAARLRVDLARIRASGLPSVLFVSHVGGGGTERHLHELAGSMATQANVFLLRPMAAGEAALEWLRSGEGFQLGFVLPEQNEALLQALRAVGVAHVHYHHLRGHSPEILELPASLAVTHDFTAHDYYSVCPQVTLSDEIGRYCGELGAEQCSGCLARRPAPGGESIETWRAQFGPLLERARYVLAPSEDAAARLRRYFPDAKARHAPHLDVESAPQSPQPRPISGGRALRIVVIGALSQIKGADLLDATAVLAAQRDSRLEFHLLGYAYKPLRTAPGTRLTVHGEYVDADLAHRLDAIGADVAWFPALWPETYSYTLSAALSARLPVVASELGAFPERLSGRPWTWICPWYWLSQEWVLFFEGLLTAHFDPASAPPCAPLRPVGAERFSYGADYLRGLPVRGAAGTLSAAYLERHRVGRATVGAGS